MEAKIHQSIKIFKGIFETKLPFFIFACQLYKLILPFHFPVVGQAHIFAPLNPLLLRPCLNKKYNESKLCI
jgi:hypothetical protein